MKNFTRLLSLILLLLCFHYESKAQNNGLHFDGVDDYVSVTNPYYQFGKEITVEWWQNRTATVADGAGMGQGTAGSDDWTNGNVWLMHWTIDNKMIFYVNDNGTPRGTPAYAVGTGWHHFVGVATATATKLYVDGVLASTGPGVSVGIKNNSNSVIHLGKDVRYNSNRFYVGTIDEVRIWNRALCGPEITNSWACESNAGNRNGLVEYYKLNRGTAGGTNNSPAVNTAPDSSSFLRHGVLNNFTLTGSASNWVAGQVTTVCSYYQLPTISGFTGSTDICSGSATTLTATSTASSPTFGWYNGSEVGSAFFTGASYTTGNLTSATLYFTTVTDGNGCISYPRQGVTVFTNTIANQSVSASPATMCGSGTSSITTGTQATANYSLYNGATLVSGPTQGTGSSLNLPTGTISSTTTYTVKAAMSKPGAIAFTGGSGSVSNSVLSLNLALGFTVEGWVYINNFSNHRGFASKGINNVPAPFDIYFNTAGKLNFYAGNGVGTPHQLTSTMTFSSLTWYHLALVYDPSQSKILIYVNGVLESSASVTNSNIGHNGSNPYLIGNRIDGATPMDGKIDEFRIWNGVRTVGQISSNMNNCLPTPQTNLSLYYRFDDPVGSTTANDASGNGMNGTLTNLNSVSSWVAGKMSCGTTSCGPNSMTTTPTVTVNTIPAAPSGSGASRCGTGTVTISATPGAGETIDWYAAASGGTALLSGSNSYTATISGTTIFYAEARNITTGCKSATRTAVTATWNFVASTPTGTNGLRCGTGTVTISASSGPNAIDWYDAATGGTLLATGSNSFNTPSISSTTTYYAEARNTTTGCKSATRTAVTATVNSIPSVTAGSNSPVNVGAAINLTATTISGASYAWTGPAGFTSADQNPSISNAQSSNAGTYEVIATVNGCASAPSTVNVIVNSLPASALNFDGVNDNVTLSGIDVSNSSFTFECWAAPSAVNRDNIIAGQGPTVNSNGLHIGFRSNNVFTFAFYFNDLNTVASYSDLNWHHWACTYSTSGGVRVRKIYRDGVLVASDNPGANFQGSGTFYIGQHSWGANFQGSIDEVRIWNRALCQGEIQNNMNCELDVANQTGLVSAYHFNQGYLNANNNTVATLTDAAGANTGTLNNFALNGATSNWSGGTVTGTCTTFNPPTISGVTGTTTICSGSNTTLTASSSASSPTFGWYNAASGGTLLFTGAAYTTAALTSSTIFYVDITSSGCTSVRTAVSVTVNPLTSFTSCPSSNVVSNTSAGNCNAVVAYTASSAGTMSYTFTGATSGSGSGTGSGATFNVGTTNVTITSAGICGNATCSFSVVVSDATPPTAVCQNATVTLNASGTGTITTPATTSTMFFENWTSDAANYYINTNLTNWVLTGDLDRANFIPAIPGDEVDLGGFQNGTITTHQTFTFTPGSYTFSFQHISNTFNDNAVKVDIGTLLSQTFASITSAIRSESVTFTVTSTTTAKIKMTQLGASDAGGSFIGQILLVKNIPAGLAIENGSSDNCAVTSITASQTNFDCSHLGNNTVILTVTDLSGNTATCNATVTVTDNIFPVLSGIPSPNITVDCEVPAVPTVTATDNCTSPISVTYFQVPTIAVNTAHHWPADGNLNDVAGSGNGTAVGTVNYATGILGSNAFSFNGSSYINTGPGGSISYSNQSERFAVGAWVKTTSSGVMTVVQQGTIGSSGNGYALKVGIGSTGSAQPGKVYFTLRAGQSSSVASTRTVNDGRWHHIIGECDQNQIRIYVDGALDGSANNASLFGISSSSPTAIGADASLNQHYFNGLIDQVKVYSTSACLAAYERDRFWVSGDASSNYTAFNQNIHVVDIAPPVITGTSPDIDNIIAESGQCGAFVDFVEPTFSDNCAVANYTISHNPGSLFQVGTTTVTYWAVDNCGNTATSSFNITVKDVTPPVLYCQQYTFLIADPGQCTKTIAIEHPQFFDNCGTSEENVTFVNDHPSDIYPIGETLITWTATDASGNSSTCSQTITVIDYEAPVINCVTDITVEAEFGRCSAPVIFPITATDNCGTPEITYNVPSGTRFDVGDSYFTARATDASGNYSNLCLVRVHVLDRQVPVITCPANITANGTSAAGATVTYANPTVSDNCSATLTMISGLASGSTFPIGTTTVRYQAVDPAGNSSECSFDVTVSGVPPQIVCPADIIVNTDAGQCGATITFAATETTGIPASTITYSIEPGSFFNTGTVTVTATATNELGTSSCTFTVTVEDHESPVARAHDLTIQLSGPLAAFPIDQIDNGSSDACGIRDITISQNTFTCAEVGTHIVTLTVTDFHGNVSTATATVTVVDYTLPIAISQDVTIQLDATGHANVTAGMVNNGSTDNCSIQSMSVAPNAFDCSNTGQTNFVTLTVTDASGNTSQADAMVTVQDNLNPVMTCPSNIIVTTNSMVGGVVVSYNTPTATDNCPGVVVVLTEGRESGSSFPIGTTTVTYRATDANGNFTDCSFTITVNFVCPAITVDVTSDISCTGPNSGTITVATTGGEGGYMYRLNDGGYQASNVFSNLAPGTYSVTVKDANNCSGIQMNINLVEPFCLMAEDDHFENCSNRSITILKSTLLANDANPWNHSLYMDVAQPAHGTVVDNGSSITYTPQNGYAGVDQFNYTIKKEDGTIAFAGNGHVYEWAPAIGITWNLARIGAAQRTYNGMQGYLVTVTSQAEMDFVASKLQGAGWMGASDRAFEGTWRWVTGPEGLEDGSQGRHFSNQFKSPFGNCAASTAPALIGLYANWAGSEPNDCGANLNQYSPTDQNRGGEHYAHFYGGGIWNDYPDNVGNNILGYIVEYGGMEGPVASSGTSTASVVINNNMVILTAHVNDETCAGAANGSIDLSVSDGTAPYTYAWNGGVSTEDRTGLSTGTYTVTVTDSAGCSGIASFNVMISDVTNPVAITKNITIQLDAGGNATISANDVNDGSNDACGISAMSVSPNSFTCSNLGENIVTLTVTDPSGNQGSATAIVTVNDNTPPIITCPANVSVSATSGSCGAIIDLNRPTASDNCSTMSNGLAFDGVDDYVTVPRSVSGDFTIEYWMKTTQTGSTGANWYHGKGIVDAEVAGVTNDFGTSLYGNKVSFGVGLPDRTIFSTTDVNGGNWIHVAATRKQSTGEIILYVNGVQEATATGTTAALTSPSFIRLGAMQTLTNSYFNGSLDEIRIWSVVRTPSEIQSAMSNSLSGPLPSGLVAYYKCDQGVAGGANNLLTTINSSTGVNSGSLTNFALSGSTSNWVAGTTGIPSLTLSNSANNSFNASGFYPVGVTNITWTATDGSGNTNTCNQTVTVTDNSVPNVLTKAVTVYLDQTGSVSLTPEMVDNGSNDACGIQSMSVSPSTLGCSNAMQAGSGNGSFSARMTADNQYTIYVSTDDNVQGTLFGSGNNWPVAGNHTTTLTPGVTNYIHIRAEDVGGVEMMIGDFTLSGGFKFANGTQSAKSNATDFRVSSSGWSGYGAPIELSTGNSHSIWGTIGGISSGARYIWSNPWNTAAAGDVRYFSIAMSPISEPANVTLFVTDIHNNTGSSGALVTVLDTIRPVINCGADISMTASSASGAVVNYATPTATDNCSAIVARISGAASGSTFPIGTTVVTHSATDLAGNSVTCSFNVVITGLPPVIHCPATVTVPTDLDECGANVMFAATETTAIPASTITYSIAPGSFFTVGTMQITATATNPVGTSSCTFDVVVQDHQVPHVITQPVTIQLDATGHGSITTSQVNNGSSDACGIASYELSQSSFDCSDVGSNTVLLIVTDVHGNVAERNATITVQDVTPPVAHINDTIYVRLDENDHASVTASQFDNGSTDACGIASVAVTPNSFDCDDIGFNPVTFTVTDENGNSTSVPAMVYVNSYFHLTYSTETRDECAPVTVTWTGGCSSWNVQLMLVSVDRWAVQNTIVVGIPNSGSYSWQIPPSVPAGTYLFYVAESDHNYNWEYGPEFTITNTPPNVITQNITVQLDATGNASITAAQVDNGSNDICGISSMTVSPNHFTCANVGDNTVTLTVTDLNGNVVSADAVVTVEDHVAPAVITQPITVQLDASGHVSIAPAQVNNGSTDACGIASYSLDVASFDCSDVGGNTVTLSVTDIHGNTGRAMAVVTVQDVTPPVAHIIDTIYVRLDENDHVSINASQIDNGSTDACGIASLGVSPNSFDCDNIGFNPVVFTATDVNGNATHVNAMVYVNSYFNFTYNIDTLEECDPVNITWNGGCSGWNVDLSLVKITPFVVQEIVAEDIPNSGSHSWTVPPSVPAGLYQFYVEEGGEPNAKNWTYGPVFYIRNTPPNVITQNITVQLDATGNTSITAAQVNNGSNDICGIASMTVSPGTFTCSNIGPNTVTLTVTDLNGNVVTADAVVTVEDHVAPAVVTQPLTIQLDASGNASITPAQINNGSSDACGIASYALDKTTFNCSNVGANTVVLIVTDVNGNVAEANAVVTVQDITAPVVATNNVTVYLDASGNASITAEQVHASSSDACGVASMSVSPNTFNCANTGANTVTLSVTDVNGNIGSAPATVTVIDNIKPMAICKPALIGLDANGVATVDPALINNGSYDNCGVTLTASPASFNCSQMGYRTVVLTATDPSGNFSRCTTTVYIKDTVRPVIACPADIILYTSSSSCKVKKLISVSATDNCDDDVDIDYNLNDGECDHGNHHNCSNGCHHRHGNHYGNGHDRGCDRGHGHDRGCNWNDDHDRGCDRNHDHGRNCNHNHDHNRGCDRNHNYGNCNHNCDHDRGCDRNHNYGNCNHNYYGNHHDRGCDRNHNNGNCNDNCGHDRDCDRNHDHGRNCNSNNDHDRGCDRNHDRNRSCNNGHDHDRNCDRNHDHNRNCNNNQNDDDDVTYTFPLGTTPVVVTATDDKGNVSVCNFNVIVIDNVKPVAKAKNLTVTLNSGGSASITASQVNYGSDDNCGIASMSVSPNTFNCLMIGANEVILVVTDNSGNVSTDTAIVTVRETTKPVARTRDLTVYLDASGNASITAAQINNGSTDNCGIVSMSVSPSTFNCSSVGNRTVKLTVVDGSGNSDYENAKVTVIDNIKPVITCPANIVAYTTSTTCGKSITLNVTATDNCDADVDYNLGNNNNASCSHGNHYGCGNGCHHHDHNNTSGNTFTFPVGTTTVVATASDNSGNSSTCSFTVTVVDNTPPYANAKNITVNLNSGGSASINASQVNNGSSDACGIAVMSVMPNTFTCANIGANTVTLTVTDNNGNTSSDQAVVTVKDVTSPVALTKNISVNLSESGSASITAAMINNGSSDGCGIASMSVSPSSFDCSDLGANAVTLTVTDAGGNVSTKTATVTVNDITPPVALAKNITLNLTTGVATITAAQVNNGSSDECGIKTMTLSKTSFNCTNIGSNPVTLTVTDKNNNTSAATATVTVVGSLPSVSINVTPNGSTYTGDNPNTIYLGYGPQSVTLTATGSGSAPLTYSWSGASNCSNATGSTFVFAPNDDGTYYINCTVTNSFGCRASATVAICVLDIRSGNNKVYLCHVPPGNSNNPQTLSIAASAVPAHLSGHTGDRLGSCNMTCGFNKTEIQAGDIYSDGQEDLVVFPNPSKDQFRFNLESGNISDVTVKIFDITGKLVMEDVKGLPNADIVINASGLADGVYNAEVTHGDFRKVVKITKID